MLWPSWREFGADPAEDALGLPSGYGQFHIPLVLSSKY
jgi:bilirubin oxidase